VEAGAQTRAALRAAFATPVEGFQGATGMRGFAPNRDPDTAVRLVRIRAGAVVPFP
jgi:hypothetical protein